MLNRNAAMALIATAGLAASASGQVIITEIFFATNQGNTPATSNERSQEFVEITNVGTTDVDISGWALRDDGTTETFPMGTILLAGQSLVLYGTENVVPVPDADNGDALDPTTFAAQWPGGAGINSLFLTPFESLSNGPNPGNEILQIIDAAENVIDEVNYDDAFPWPSDTPQGSSIVLLPEFIDPTILSLIGETADTANDNGLAWRRADQIFQGGLKTDGGILSNEIFLDLADLLLGVFNIVPPSDPDAGLLTPATNFASPGTFDTTPDDNDLNNNGFDDDVDFFLQISFDTNGNGIPDEVEVDCNNNGVADDLEFTADLDLNGNPDFCDINDNGGTDGVGGTLDVNENGIIDGTEVADVIITEIMFNPAGPENESEWVEVYNAGTVAVDLLGWGIADLETGSDLLGREDISDGIDVSLILEPGEVALIINDYNDAGSRDGSSALSNVAGAFDDVTGDPLTDPVAEFRLGWNLDPSVKIVAVGDWGSRANNASPGDEILALYAPAAGVITDTTVNDLQIVVADIVDYDADLTPFTTAPSRQWPGDTGTWSYQLRSDSLNEDANDNGGNWFGVIDGLNGGVSTTGLSIMHSSIRTEGSPGTLPPMTLEVDGSGEVVISEIYAAPNVIGAVDTGEVDALGAPILAPWQNEWVEIYNTTGAELDISGWYLRDEDGFTEPFPAGTTLAAGEAAVVFGIETSTAIPGPDFILEYPSAIAAKEAFYDAWQCGYQVIAVRGWADQGTNAFGFDSNSLNNLSNGPSPANEVLRVYKADGSLVDVVNFEDADGLFEGVDWPNDPTGDPTTSNFSIFANGNALNAAANNLGGNWLPTIVGLDVEARNNIPTEFFTVDTTIVTSLQEASPGIVPGGAPLDLSDCPEFPCNAADIVEPFGVLDLADIDGFIIGFGSGGTIADIAEPFGVLDLVDIDTFILSFGAGCQ